VIGMTTDTIESSTGRLTAVWLLLMALTVVSTWGLSKELLSAEVATTGILALAAVKVRWVMLDFMELRGAPLAGRLVFEAWSVLVPAVLVVLYLVG
jgi:heme/copper-type cytochrome/quinol oxidase subunit 4